MSTNRRDFLKLAGAAAAAITSAAAAHAGVPASSVAKFDDEYDVVIIGSGFAGMACARKAGQARAKVLTLFLSKKCRPSAATPQSAAATSLARSTPSRQLKASKTAKNSSLLTA